MTKTIVLGGGCFWCTEALFQRVAGVLEVVPGYAGGKEKNPSYEEVATGTTGHAEVIRVSYDSLQVSLEHLLRIFFATHNPTTLNMQGSDVGSEYRSIILYSQAEDVPVIKAVMRDVQMHIQDDIVTEVQPLGVFYEAEAYHHNYYEQNGGVPYCHMVIEPKLNALRSYLREYPV